MSPPLPQLHSYIYLFGRDFFLFIYLDTGYPKETYLKKIYPNQTDLTHQYLSGSVNLWYTWKQYIVTTLPCVYSSLLQLWDNIRAGRHQRHDWLCAQIHCTYGTVSLVCCPLFIVYHTASLWVLVNALPIGFTMGILRVRISLAVIAPLDTAPTPGMGDNQPIIHMVYYETCSISDTYGACINF